MKTYDIIVVGTGGATIVADAAINKGKKVAIIEKGKFGGTCLTRGCIPTKVMVTVADAVREIEELPKIGVKVQPATIDWNLMSKRVWQKIDESKGVEAYYDKFDNVDLYRGAATFVKDKVLTVAMNTGEVTEEITAPIIVLGVGGHTKVNPIKGLDEAGYMSSESLFGNKYPQKPFKSLVVMGGGPIGTEFAHVFAAAGTKVTLIQHNVRLLPKEDAEISEQIYKDITRLGIDVILNQEPEEVRVENGEKIVVIRDRKTGEIREVRGEEILMASGIKPATEELKLENTSIQTKRGGWIVTNEFLETSVDGVYALGDINGEAPFRHKANYEADILAHNLFYATSPQDFRWARYDLVPAVTFTYPQVGHVGLTEQEALEKGYAVKTGKNFYSSTAKGFAMGFDPGDDNDGFVKIVVDEKTNHILGVHVIGPQASILFQPFVNLLNSGDTPLAPINEEIGSTLTKQLRQEGLVRKMDPHSVITVGETMSPHPTLSEVIMWTQVYYEHRW
ncbi:dihydrolipoyl dehydrogenase family protein [Veillonella criceti]|uniref:Mycothione reductase n=1 Tax=Veillonella criceti TaxID=103891 RepID=A0A380NFV1_9FIRM|nr:FAD-dependent oxidoreductase [Veillonella criceti]SUP40032.1 Mycothione reductase [Veillonella criceti]